MIPQQNRTLWAETFGEVCENLNDACNPAQSPNNHLDSFELILERRIKMFFILPFLILRKSPDKQNRPSMNHTIRQRLAQWKSRDYATLIQDYERDVIYKQTNDNHSPPSNNKEASYRKTVELIRLGKLRRARHNVVSKGCSDPAIPHIVEQMKSKFPKRKSGIQPPTDAQFNNLRATLDIDVLKKAIAH